MLTRKRGPELRKTEAPKPHIQQFKGSFFLRLSGILHRPIAGLPHRIGVLTRFLNALGFRKLCEDRFSQFVPAAKGHKPGKILGDLAVTCSEGLLRRQRSAEGRDAGDVATNEECLDRIGTLVGGNYLHIGQVASDVVFE